MSLGALLFILYINYMPKILKKCKVVSIKITKMQKLQNKAMNIISKCDRYTYINVMLYDFKWMNVKQTLQSNTLMFISKMKKRDAPKYLREHIKYRFTGIQFITNKY